MAALSTQWGTEQLGQIPYGGAPAVAATTPIYTNEQYALRLAQADGTPIASLHEWSSARLIKTANKPSTLRIILPIGDTVVDNALVYPNVVTLYGRAGNLVDIFTIREVTESRAVKESWEILCFSKLYQFGRDVISSYEATTPTSVRTILEAWFNDYQLNTTLPILALGTLDSTIADTEVTIKIENQSLLAAINQLYRTIGGFFWVTADNVFNWTIHAPNPQTVRTIRWNHSMGAIRIKTDYGKIYTRVVASATDADGNAISYTANSDNQGTYGVLPYLLDTPGVKTEAQLQAFADKLVDILKTPRRSTTVEAIDLSKVDSPVDLSHEDIDIHYPVRFVHPDSNATIATRTITRLEVDLKDPAAIRIESTDPENQDPDTLIAKHIDSDSIVNWLLNDFGDAFDPGAFDGGEFGGTFDGGGGGGGGDSSFDPDGYVARYEGAGSPTIGAPVEANAGDRYIDTTTGKTYRFDPLIGAAPGTWVPESHLEA